MGSKELLFSISANFWEVEVSVGTGADMPVWAIAGVCGLMTDASAVSVSGSGLAGFAAKFKEFSGGFSGVDAAVCSRSPLALSSGILASSLAGAIGRSLVFSTSTESAGFNSSIPGISTGFSTLVFRLISVCDSVNFSVANVSFSGAIGIAANGREPTSRYSKPMPPALNSRCGFIRTPHKIYCKIAVTFTEL